MPCEYINSLIAAGAALAGVLLSLLGNWLLSHLQHGHESKTLLRSKYEELANLVEDSLLDYQKIISADTTLELLRETRPAFAQKAHVLAQLYFPELKTATYDYLEATVDIRNACAAAPVENPKASLLLSASSSPKVQVAQEALENAKHNLDNQLQKYAKTYTLA